MDSTTGSLPGGPGAAARALAFLAYCGLAPFWALAGRWRPQSPFLRHHTRQAAGIFLLLLAVILVFALVVAGISLVVVFDARLYENYALEGFALNTSRRLFLCWLVFLAFSCGLALLGSERRLPLAARLGDIALLRRSVWAVFGGCYAAAALLSPFIVHAHHLAGPAGRPAPVVMLYENNDVFPRWVFTAWFYPMTRAARQALGPDSVQVARLTEASLKEAMGHARFLFIGSHGGRNGLLLKGLYFSPERLRDVPASPGLEFVYLAGCEGGAQREEWEQAFAPATVLTYDRPTAVVEHAWWLWTRGPDMVRAMQPIRAQP